MTDPFDALASPVEPQTPRPTFARELRSRLVAALGLDPADAQPTIDLPQRSPAMPTAVSDPVATASVVPYLAVSGGARALDWYAEAFGAVEQMRVVGDDGRIGHAGFSIGSASFMLSDEYPEIGVNAPSSLGGTTFSIHLTVGDVDAVFARAVAAGATAQSEPADQPHGARHGTLIDPFGHRWMVSQQVEVVTVADYAERTTGSGFEVVPGTGEPARGGGSIWAVAFYEDAMAGIRQLVDVFGFEEIMVATADDGVTVVHSELRWPDGGIVQVGTYDPDSPYSIPPGMQSLYLVTPNPQAVWERCAAAGLEVLQEPYSPHYDPTGMGFTVRDRERNIWSVGSYGTGTGG
jgi:PhnB protein